MKEIKWTLYQKLLNIEITDFSSIKITNLEIVMWRAIQLFEIKFKSLKVKI